jgi:acetate kinase
MTPVLLVNAGSSSVRLALADVAARPVRVTSRIRVDRHVEQGQVEGEPALRQFLGPRGDHLTAVAHRVVHGGPDRRQTTPFDDAVEADIRRAAPLAPLHNPATLAWLQACRRFAPGIPQLAVFDSGFFASLPPAAATYPLPLDLRMDLRCARLGFHGLAHRSLWQTFAASRPARARRVITFQLGSGCSAAALLDGTPVDTSMGFTPLEGLMMRTRPGDVDPGILLLLLARGLSAGELGDLLETRSGLAGVSGTSGDMRELVASDRPEAALALEMFCYRARKYLGAFMAALGGCDAVLLGGGIAEHTPSVRAGILSGLQALGLELDPVRNQEVGERGRISTDASSVAIWVLPTDEESVMADEAARWLVNERHGEAP